MTTLTEEVQRQYHRVNVTSTAFWAKTTQEREESFRILRDEAPVSWQPLMEGQVKPPPHEGLWAVTRHEHIVAVTRDPETFVSGKGVMFNNYSPRVTQSITSILAMDGAQHTRMRKLISAAFTPRQLARMDESIRAQSATIIDGLLEAKTGDFVELVSTQLPMWTINEMMGLHGDLRDEARHYAQVVVGWTDEAILAGRSPQQVFQDALLNLIRIGMEFAAHRRENPADDLMTNLVNAEIDGQRLTDEEIGAFFILLTVAGNDTTANTTSHGIRALLRFPEQKALLMEDFDGRIGSAVEEFIRYGSPVLTFRRTAARDTVLAGQQIREGDWVALYYPSGNYDERAVEKPHEFNILRKPNAHISFGGGGPHYCLGVSIARRQLRELFHQLLHRVPDLQLGEPEFMVSSLINTVKRMPCSVS
jgi:cytochrome P450